MQLIEWNTVELSLLQNNGLSNELLAFINGFMNHWYMELVMMFMNGLCL